MDNKLRKTMLMLLLLGGCGLTSLVSSWLGEKEEGTALAKLEQKAFQNNQGNGSVYAHKTNGTKTGTNKPKNGIIKVYINGAVVLPGIYELEAGARLEQALQAAGGMLPEAKAGKVNLARILKDGAQVYIPFENEATRNVRVNHKQGKANADKSRSKSDEGKTAYSKSNKNTGSLSTKININTANQKELESLPGIGPAMASRIISEREKSRFSRLEDLRRVPGIGASKLQRLKDLVEL